MPSSSTRKPWFKDLVAFFDSSSKKVFSRMDLAELLNQEGPHIGIPPSMRLTRLITYLIDEGQLHQVEILREGRTSSEGSKKRYVWRQASPYSIGLSLSKNSYLSHSSAMFLHALTEQVPKTIYVNKEQSPKPKSKSGLSQPAIDRAFKNSPRTSKYIFTSHDFRFVLLGGKYTGRLEVSRMVGPGGDLLDVTELERTLIDVVVRSTYAGGVYQVLEAYRNARDRVSVNKLLATLRKLDYVYPYHQAVGFLMQRAGYDERQLRKVEALGRSWNLYLDYRIADPEFDERWRLFHPKGL